MLCLVCVRMFVFTYCHNSFGGEKYSIQCSVCFLPVVDYFCPVLQSFIVDFVYMKINGAAN